MSEIELFFRKLINIVSITNGFPSVHGRVRLDTALSINVALQHVHKTSLWTGILERKPEAYYV